MNERLDDRENENLKEIERKRMEDDVVRLELKAEKLYPNNALTPAEHILFGSTAPGLACNPNRPIGLSDKISLEVINKVRSENPNWPFFVRYDRNNFVGFTVKLLPVSPEQVADVDWQKSFEINYAHEPLEPDKHLDMPSDLEIKISDYIKQRQEKNRENMKKEK